MNDAIVATKETINGIDVLDFVSVEGGIDENMIFAITCDCVEEY